TSYVTPEEELDDGVPPLAVALIDEELDLDAAQESAAPLAIEDDPSAAISTPSLDEARSYEEEEPEPVSADSSATNHEFDEATQAPEDQSLAAEDDAPAEIIEDAGEEPSEANAGEVPSEEEPGEDPSEEEPGEDPSEEQDDDDLDLGLDAIAQRAEEEQHADLKSVV